MNIENIIHKRNSNISYRIGSHLIFWILLFFSNYFIVKFSFDIYRDTPLSYLTPLRNIIGVVLVFYPLMYGVLPHFLKHRKWAVSLSFIFFLIFFYTFFDAAIEKVVFQYCSTCLALALEYNPKYISVIQKSLIENILFKASNFQFFLHLFSSLILPIAIKTSLGYYNFYIKSLELEKEKVHFELNFLKAQVNPHFLFNTLNNLYGLVMHERTNKSMDAISRLSEFLRYTLDNANKKTILLSEEINLIRNYIELEKLRLNHSEVTLNIDVDQTETPIPPLLFIPLLENAFKYNLDQRGTFIGIDLNEKDGLLHFKVQNSFEKANKNRPKGGLGLKNLEKRLKLYFNDKYVYKVSKTNSIYTAYLNFNLK